MENITFNEYIKRIFNNDYSFLRTMSINKKLEFSAKIKKNINYKKICSKVIQNCKDHNFIFTLIYNQIDYEDETIKLLDSYGIILTKDMLPTLISISSKIRNYLINNIYNLKGISSSELIESLGTYMIMVNDDLTPLKKHPNLEVRYIFLSFIIKNYNNILRIIPDLEECFIKKEFANYEQIPIEPEIMKEEYLCELLLLTLDNEDYETYNIIKEFILKYYKENSLASKLLNFPKKETYKKAFIEDADRLFKSSKNFQDEIVKTYSVYVSKDLIESFINKYKLFFQTNEIEYGLRAVFSEGLQKELLNLVNTYLSISKDKTCKKLASGFTAEVYKIGDFVIKLIHHKCEKEPCPNLFLTIKNLEEIYIKSDGYVIAGIEVQRYLDKEIHPFEYEELEELFLKELEALGYKYTDSLLSHKDNKEQNARYLSSYKEANCKNPEDLPEWFKTRPIVLIDRDNVRKIF